MNIDRLRAEHTSPAICSGFRTHFSAYLDGEISGRSMAAMAAHLDACPSCSLEFSAWRAMQDELAAAGRVPAPANLQRRLRAAIHREHLAQSHLSAPRRLAAFWRQTAAPLLHETVAPMALRAVAGLVIAASLLGGLTWLYAGPMSVEANDDNLAHLSAPRYLYSQAPPQSILTRNDTPILIDAKVDDRGRVYDFSIVEGPQDPAVRLQVEQNLLGSVFHPATIFGEPVRGHVMLTYTGVSVHG
jgi:hypothetical protein